MSAGAEKTIAGRYELGERLGLGGMSTVQVAFDTRLERYVAVKLLAEHLADDAQFVTRFRREAMAAARLVHPNIVQVYDFGLDEPSGRHYIVMERIVGPSGAQVLRDRGHLPIDEAVDWIAQSCRGLEYAHRTGSSTATSSPATCCSPKPTGRSSSRTSGSPRPRATSRRSRRSARSWAPPPTWRPSRPRARRPGRPPTCTGWASSPTSC